MTRAEGVSVFNFNFELRNISLNSTPSLITNVTVTLNCYHVQAFGNFLPPDFAS